MPAPMTPNTSEVARLLGVGRSAVSRWRGGHRVPRLEARKAIAQVLEWPISAQAEAEAVGKWSEQFEKALRRSFSPTP
jgi:transcriptional regulator with XRE-family HTH domain